MKSAAHLVQKLLGTRKRLGYTQHNLATVAGISRRAVAAIETGGDCTLSTLRKLSSALDIELSATRMEGMPTLDDMVELNRRERFGQG